MSGEHSFCESKISLLLAMLPVRSRSGGRKREVSLIESIKAAKIARWWQGRGIPPITIRLLPAERDLIVAALVKGIANLKSEDALMSGAQMTLDRESDVADDAFRAAAKAAGVTW